MPQKNVTKLIIIGSFLLSILFGGFLAYKQQMVDAAAPTDITDMSAFKKSAKGEMAAFIAYDAPIALPEISFLNEKGETIGLDAFKGRTILLNVWATWCAPCRHEMPTLDALQKDLGSDKFEVVTLNVDRKSSDGAKAFFSEIGIKHLALYADPTAKSMGKLKARGLPLTMLINKDGMEVGRLFGPANWNSADAVELIKSAIQ